jgi:DNA (cytosine-5)-methyltransferase 1
MAIANVPTDWKVWTGSCPCQPFSNASIYQKGTEDDRHLWPHFKEAIAYGKPPIIFGEQVASELGRSWLSEVRPELEVLGYGVGATDISAAGVGFPHTRQRIFFVANSDGNGLEGLEPKWDRRGRRNGAEKPALDSTLVQPRDKFNPDILPLLQVDGLSRQLAIDVLGGFGNAIIPELGATFIISALEAIEETYGA